MDYGLDPGLLALEQHQHQQQERPPNQQQDEDCFHSEGDDNFKVTCTCLSEVAAMKLLGQATNTAPLPVTHAHCMHAILPAQLTSWPVHDQSCAG